MAFMSASRGRPRSYDRDHALEQAMLLFWERGFEGAGTRELCAAMGISPPSLYHAFGSKQQLFEEVVRTYSQRYTGFVEAAFEEEPDARRAALRLLTGAAHQYTQPGCPAGCLIMNSAAGPSSASPEVESGLQSIRRAISRRLLSALRTDQEAGLLPAALDVHGFGMHVLAIWNGMSMQARDGARREELEAGIAAFMATWPATQPH